MNKRMILYIQGAILLIESAIMVLPIATALIYREPSGVWFFYTALAAAICGFAAMKLSRPRFCMATAQTKASCASAVLPRRTRSPRSRVSTRKMF